MSCILLPVYFLRGVFAAKQVLPGAMTADAWVLVTGANRGLGYATARALVNAGESVIVGARSQAAGAHRHVYPAARRFAAMDHSTHP